jgi:methylated-DNA-protein-cysteine methyltransferase related protein
MAVSNEVIFARIRRVPPGFVTTYGDLTPGAPRHSARAMSRGHPDADLPWWRVVRSDGSLAKGDDQRARLMEEDVPFRRGRVIMAEARIPPEAIY